MVDLAWTLGPAGADLELADDDLVVDEGLRSAVLVSLFTDGRADDDAAPFPDGTDDPRGFWADEPGARLGSLLWTFERAKLTTETIEAVRNGVETALAWLLAEGIASEVVVAASRSGTFAIELSVTITRGNSPRWSHLWDAVEVQAETISAGDATLNLLFR